jgi:hypothetical protein
MTKAAKKGTAPDPGKPASRNAVEMIALPDEAPSRTIARRLLDPATTAGCTLHHLYRGVSEEGNVNGYIAELQQQARAANAGDLSRPEATLTAQAQTLDALFHTLTGWALNNAKEGGNAAYFETCMRLALKAQSQARATVETLAAIKNPPVVYARQANFAAGHQQVNNGAQASGVREIERPPTKLLEAEHGKRLDTRTTAAAIGIDQEMDTVGAVNGSANCRG